MGDFHVDGPNSPPVVSAEEMAGRFHGEIGGNRGTQYRGKSGNRGTQYRYWQDRKEYVASLSIVLTQQTGGRGKPIETGGKKKETDTKTGYV
jgi:hypothetical protein